MDTVIRGEMKNGLMDQGKEKLVLRKTNTNEDLKIPVKLAETKEYK